MTWRSDRRSIACFHFGENEMLRRPFGRDHSSRDAEDPGYFARGRRLGFEDGMPRECVLNLDHADTVAKGFIGDRITALGAEKPHAVFPA